MEVLHITKDNFDEIVMNGDKPVLLDFYADWCGPCKALAPVFAEMAAERNDVVFAKVNIDQEIDLAKTFKVRSVPTLVLMDARKNKAYCAIYGDSPLEPCSIPIEEAQNLIYSNKYFTIIDKNMTKYIENSSNSTIFEENQKDLFEIPEQIITNLEIKLVSNFETIYDEVFRKNNVE